ncbi:MAG: Bro-N domain-containing protein [Saprospiraceae bacterium]|nr:Bro-N domain-containing protein [Saprospiraceae bacterium]
MENNKIILFQEKEIRRVWHAEEWYFSVIDVIEALTDSVNPRKYWSVLKNREPQLATICSQLKITASDGKKYKSDAANTEGVFRLIMSVPSPKAEPFKQWLAQIGKERLDEMADPELAAQRSIDYYRAKGYSDEWIERRQQSIEARKRLTTEWQKRGVKEGQEYAILTAEIAKATFGLTPSQHAQLKSLEKENLRDHMTPLELIFTALGEEATRLNAISLDAQGFTENHEAALKGGNAAGEARKRFESVQNTQVVSPENYLHLLQKKSETDELPPQ